MPDNSLNEAQSQLAELRVSGHTMTLDPGLYCIFSVPDGPVPDPETGLPVVRISPPPGALADRVELLGLDPNGWIGPEAATLVRVKQSRSNLLVTVYQATGTVAEAPQLQVVRISAPSPSTPTRDAAIITDRPPQNGQATRADPETVEVVAHIYGRGDIGAHIGLWVGEPGSKRWIEGFGVSAVGAVPASDIEYQAVLGRGWLSPWSSGGQFCGSRGMSLPILGLRVRLLGASAATHRVTLSATFVDGSNVGPVSGDEACEAPTLAALEAFQLAIDPVKAESSKPANPSPARQIASTPAAVKLAAKNGAKPRPVAAKRALSLAETVAEVSAGPVPTPPAAPGRPAPSGSAPPVNARAATARRR